MKITNGGDWISIVFDCYAGEAVFVADNLKDVRNSVSVDYNFYLQGTGWGRWKGSISPPKIFWPFLRGLHRYTQQKTPALCIPANFPSVLRRVNLFIRFLRIAGMTRSYSPSEYTIACLTISRLQKE